MFLCFVVLSGLPAKEIHVCGSGIAVDVVKRIVESVGERIEVKHYDRLLPLVTLNNSLGKHGCTCIQEEHNKANRFLFLELFGLISVTKTADCIYISEHILFQYYFLCRNNHKFFIFRVITVMHHS